MSQEKVSGKTITYTNSGQSENKERIVIKNEKNKLSNIKRYYPKSVSFFPDLSIVKLDEKQLTEILLSAFSFNRLKHLQNEKDLSIFFYLNDSGKILEVSFVAGQGTKLTAQELEYIETNIKSRMNATFSKDDLKGSNYISIIRDAKEKFWKFRLFRARIPN